MAITLQTVLPQKVLPRAPSPNASSPNPGIRSAITHFIPASADASPERDAFTASGADAKANGFTKSGSSSSSKKHTRALSGSSQAGSDAGSAVAALRSPGGASIVGRKSMSAGAGSRRGIAHSSRILGVDESAEEEFALSQLTNGKVDVSFEGTLGSRPPVSPLKGKGKARAHDGDVADNVEVPLFDVDLESGQPTAGSLPASRTARFLPFGSPSMPWNKGKAKHTPIYPAPSASSSANARTAASTDTTTTEQTDDALDFSRPRKSADTGKADYSADGEVEDDVYPKELGAFDNDREQLLYAGVEDADQPGYFGAGVSNFGYNSLRDGASQVGGYGDAIGFEAVTWREGGWMMLSSVLVGILVTVAILISIDVIDWPGDGIGKL